MSYDESMSAQLLRLANSALFRQRGVVASVREAVIALGLWRVRDLAYSGSLPTMFGTFRNSISKEIFWHHAFGTAAVSHQLGDDFACGHPEQTCLCGLLHDIGIPVNSLLFLEDFGELMEQAIAGKVAGAVVERRVLGFTHVESGRILAEKWRLPLLIAETIEFHHRPGDQEAPQQITTLVHTADLFCQRFGLGYSYNLEEDNSEFLEQVWRTFCQSFPRAKAPPLAACYSLVCGLAEKAKSTADEVFGAPLAI